MGIKHFASWFNANFNEFVTPFAKTNFPLIKIDTFLIDLNGIFHMSAQKVFKYGNFAPPVSLLRKVSAAQPLDKLILDCYRDITSTIDSLVVITRPTKTLVLAIDGVAPMAKQQQQRQRRYKSAVENSTTHNAFDPTCISTGTKFMDGLSKHISTHIEKKIAAGEWAFNVVFTSEKCPGEGEHKLMSYVREHGSATDTFCLNALDADLFMLSLGSMKDNFYLLREELYNPSVDYMYVDIGRTRKKLIAEYTEDITNTNPNTNPNNKDFINDFILVCFLCGNDFLPNIPSVNICEQGLSKLLEIYKTFGTQIVVGGKISMAVFLDFLALIALEEEKMFARKITHSSQYMPDSLVTTPFVFSEYREAYNKKYFGDALPDASATYIEGCQWILDYYLGGTTDWEWSYKYNYAPFVADILLSLGESLPNYVCFESAPITPLAQLMCILPPTSFHLLPKPLNTFYILYPEYYPSVDKVSINYEGKKYKWEGVINLPPINFDAIRSGVADSIKKVAKKDIGRNAVEHPILYEKETQGTSYILNRDGSISLGNGVGKTPLQF